MRLIIRKGSIKIVKKLYELLLLKDILRTFAYDNTIIQTHRTQSVMTKLYLASLFLLLSADVQAQITVATKTAVEFMYDASGNRIRRRAVLGIPPGGGSIVPVGPWAFEITPVPTASTLTVTVPNFSSSDTGRVGLFSSQGTLLQSADITSEQTTLDISSYPAGVYVISVTVNGETKTKETVKQ